MTIFRCQRAQCVIRQCLPLAACSDLIAIVIHYNPERILVLAFGCASHPCRICSIDLMDFWRAVIYDAQTGWLGPVGGLLRSMRPSASPESASACFSIRTPLKAFSLEVGGAHGAPWICSCVAFYWR